MRGFNVHNSVVEELKARLAERYTAAEIAEYLDIPVEDLLEAYFELVPQWMLKEVGAE